MLKLVRYAVAGFVGLCAWCAFLVLIEMYRGFSDACRPVDFTVFGFRVLELVGVRDVKVPASPFRCAIFTRYISSGALSAFSGEFLSQVAQTLVPSASAAACWLGVAWYLAPRARKALDAQRRRTFAKKHGIVIARTAESAVSRAPPQKTIPAHDDAVDDDDGECVGVDSDDGACAVVE